MARNTTDAEQPGHVSSAELMDEVRTRIQRKYAGSALDSEVEAIETCVRRAADLASLRGPLLIEKLAFDDDEDRQLQTRLRFSSHRPLAGRILVSLKRGLVLPLVRWLYEYSQENFERQQQFNRTIYACLQVVIEENVRLRRDLELLEAGQPRPRDLPAEEPDVDTPEHPGDAAERADKTAHP